VDDQGLGGVAVIVDDVEQQELGMEKV